MKLLVIVSLSVLSIAASANDRRRPPGPPHDRGGFTREISSLVVELTARVAELSKPATQERRDDLAHFQRELAGCEKLRPEYMAECFRENALAVVDLAFTPERTGGYGTCTSAERFPIWNGDGANYAFIPGTSKECPGVEPYTKYEKLVNQRVRYHSYQASYFEGYRVRVLDGACAGAEGYVFYDTVENKSTCR